jgi:4-hydroxybenzoate polyprenyltransferase
MLRRILVYLNEMFPISSIIGSILTAVAVELTYLRLSHVDTIFWSRIFLPALVLTFVSLLIRVMDEFKDYQDDLKNFPNRPLPSGRVKESDLKVLGWFCVLMIILLSLTSLKLLLWAIFTLGFTFLMLKWFFIESIMRKSLPLAFISHHPIVLLNFGYLLIACTESGGDVTWNKVLMILPLCLIFTNWEVQRKIRAPDQETSYTTYSKIWGPRPAISIALVLQFIFIAGTLRILTAVEAPSWLGLVFLVAQLPLVFPSIFFLFTLKLPRPLKALAEVQIISVILTLLAARLI